MVKLKSIKRAFAFGFLVGIHNLSRLKSASKQGPTTDIKNLRYVRRVISNEM